MNVADRDLRPPVVALHPAQDAHGVALVEAASEQVDVVPDHRRDAAGAVGELEREERVAVSCAAPPLALHCERRLDEGALLELGDVGALGH